MRLRLHSRLKSGTTESDAATQVTGATGLRTPLTAAKYSVPSEMADIVSTAEPCSRMFTGHGGGTACALDYVGLVCPRQRTPEALAPR